jgi:hypothetical protein
VLPAPVPYKVGERQVIAKPLGRNKRKHGIRPPEFGPRLPNPPLQRMHSTAPLIGNPLGRQEQMPMNDTIPQGARPVGRVLLLDASQTQMVGNATVKPMTKDTSGIFAYVRLSSVHLASFLKLREIGTTESK